MYRKNFVRNAASVWGICLVAVVAATPGLASQKTVDCAKYKDFHSFCEALPEIPIGHLVPPPHCYENRLKLVGRAFSAKEAKKVAFGKKDWIIIDTRSKKDRSVGLIPRTAKLVSDHSVPGEYSARTDVNPKNQFQSGAFYRKISRHLKREVKGPDDLKGIKFIVFCNGRKCHRSTWAACSLRKMGFAQSQVHVMLGGYPEWEKSGLPTQ